jgi:hypothetical protein
VFWPELFDRKARKLYQPRRDLLDDITFVRRKITANECNNELQSTGFVRDRYQSNLMITREGSTPEN